MIKCDKCGKQITNPKDVNVVALFGIKPVKMCNNCYASKERGLTRHYFYHPRWFPLNSIPFTIILIFLTIIFSIGIIATISAGGTISVSGKPVALSVGIKFVIVLLLSVLLGWQWILWLIARKYVNATKY